MGYIHLFNTSDGMPVAIQAGLRGCGPESRARSPATGPCPAGGTLAGAAGVAQWLRASVLLLDLWDPGQREGLLGKSNVCGREGGGSMDEEVA